MVPVLFAASLLAILAIIVARTSVKGRDDGLMRLMVAAFLVRLVIHLFVRDLALFSHGGGGDFITYEAHALEITRRWHFSGLEFVTQDEMSELGPTSLPSNVFALVVWLNDGKPTSLGCTAVVAFLACLTCLNTYHLSVSMGAQPRPAYLIAAGLLFSPAVLLYTSDMYKDGLVIFLVTAAVSCSIRVARRFSLLDLVAGAFCLWALWYVRFYLVFVATAPLVVGLAGLRTRSVARPLLASLIILAVGLAVVARTEVLTEVSEKATSTFQQGTSANVRAGNADAGSGVTFDDGGNPFGAMAPKLVYMLFSPFPWAGGSIGFHLGKLDTLFWYFILYRSWLAARSLWRTEGTSVLMFLTFLVPTTVMYATSFANVGLSLRQRLVIVVVAGVLASLSWRSSKSMARSPVPPAEPARAGRSAPQGATAST